MTPGTKFNCTSCGLCCKKVGLIPGFPTKPKPGTTECTHLTSDNRCAIYETRPRVCRVDAMRPAGISLERWHRLNEEACRQLQETE